jgi:hypothetical protein
LAPTGSSLPYLALATSCAVRKLFATLPLGEPTFLYPALFSEFVVPGELRVIRREPHPQPFIYPQLDGADITLQDPANVFRLLRERTAGLPKYDVTASLDEKNRLLDEQNLR